jgi:hypothetical protein
MKHSNYLNPGVGPAVYDQVLIRKHAVKQNPSSAQILPFVSQPGGPCEESEALEQHRFHALRKLNVRVLDKVQPDLEQVILGLGG